MKMSGKLVSGSRGFRTAARPTLKDAWHVEQFWKKNSHIEGLKKAMREHIATAAQEGVFSCAIASPDMTETDRERLSAYRVLAQELGYEIARFKRSPKALTVEAMIRKL